MPSSCKKKLNVKTILNIFGIGLSAGLLLYLCLSKDGLFSLRDTQFKTIWLVLGFACTLSDLLLDTVLIYIFTKGVCSGYTFRRAAKVCMVGHLYSAITPFQSGGQPMQIYAMSKQKIDPGTSASTLIQKFFVYQTSITAYSFFAIFYETNTPHDGLNPVMWWLAMIGFAVQALAAVMILVVSFNQKFTNWLVKIIVRSLNRINIVKDYDKTLASWEKQLDFFHKSNQQLYSNKLLLVKAYLLTFLQLTALFAVSYCVYRAFGFNKATLANMIFSQAFVTMVSSLVPLPGAAGASEGSFYVFFSSYFTLQTLKSAVLIWRIVTYYAVMLISAPFSRIKDKM
jgi:hypothetical protein